MTNVTTIILTYNEERHIARAIESAARFSSQIFVVDSFSKDQTTRIASEMGAIVLTNVFVNQAAQFQWALDNAPVTGEWILRLDADEIIEPDLAQEIVDKLPSVAQDVNGVTMDRKHIFLGRWIRHGGRYPLRLLRLFRAGFGSIEQRWMDEHIVVSSGRIVHFYGGFADHNLNDLTFFTEKHNKYATREAVDVLTQRYRLKSKDSGCEAVAMSRQASFKRQIKEKIYNKLPFSVSSFGYFAFRYLGQAGFLDGREGLIYHFLQGYWYRFLVGAKILELERAINGLDNDIEQVVALERLTGLKMNSETNT
ncbi:glycosyltransferase family 2 protein [Aliirhizobium smilacinae]|uniref:Glycosyltransferase family 2 protein n=1 Tax=Aliirhizobium smilacinae TaxID=1395944 RepID=A0A5C4XPN8_9HYPH|nr:glycosyltransferase family 2 protein [Rhizobium smilacinae]TNM65317.1 glycosyltransferase family 2 protein [Rhizobium smilacinae]